MTDTTTTLAAGTALYFRQTGTRDVIRVTYVAPGPDGTVRVALPCGRTFFRDRARLSTSHPDTNDVA